MSQMFPMVVEDKTNPYCIVKLINFYRTRCHPDQQRFLCYVRENRSKDNPYYFKAAMLVGQDTIRKWVKEVAIAAGYKDAEKFTPHDNRHRCCTVLASDVNVPEKLKMNHLRHRSAKSSQVYDHVTSTTQQRVQNTLHSGFNNKKAALVPPPVLQAPAVVAPPSVTLPPLPAAAASNEGSPGTALKVALLEELKSANKRRKDEVVVACSSPPAAAEKSGGDNKKRRIEEQEKELNEAKKTISDLNDKIAMLTSELQDKKLAIGIQEGKDEYKRKEIEWEKAKSASLERQLEAARNELKLLTTMQSMRSQQSMCLMM